MPKITSLVRMDRHYDSDEISRFDALAKEWWDPEGRFKPLHQINPLRLGYIDAHTSLSRATVLDVGCGGGLLAEGLASLGAKVTGIDRAGSGLEVARLHAEQQSLQIDYHQSDAESWKEEHAGCYDVVTCMEVLEHVPDIHSTVAASAALLKPGGHFFFATLNRTPKAYLAAIIGAEYLLNWLPKGTHRYHKFIRPSEMVAAVRSAALSPESLCGLSYQVLEDQFALSDDLSINYMGMACKIS